MYRYGTVDRMNDQDVAYQNDACGPSKGRERKCDGRPKGERRAVASDAQGDKGPVTP
jgi:hypothetical protein